MRTWAHITWELLIWSSRIFIFITPLLNSIMFLDSLFNGQIKPIMNAGLFYVEKVDQLFCIDGTSLFLKCTLCFFGHYSWWNETNADKRWMLCSILLHFGGLLPRGPSRQLQNRIAADLSNFQLQKKTWSPNVLEFIPLIKTY